MTKTDKTREPARPADPADEAKRGAQPPPADQSGPAKPHGHPTDDRYATETAAARTDAADK